MSFQSIRIPGGVNTVVTPTLGEATWIDSNRVRFRDGLVEQLGGTTPVYSSSFSNPVTALKSFVSGVSYERNLLAFGTSTILGYMEPAAPPATVGSYTDIRPESSSNTISSYVQNSSATNNFLLTTSSPHLIPLSGGTNVSTASIRFNIPMITYDTVTPASPIYLTEGAYSINDVPSTTTFYITNPTFPGSTITNQGTFPRYSFETTSGSNVVLVYDGYGVGATAGGYINFSATTSVGGLTIAGTYYVIAQHPSITGAFYISSGSTNASSTDTEYQNNGVSLVTIFYGQNGSTTGLNKISGSWVLDVWGNQLIECNVGGNLYVWNPNDRTNNSAIIQQAPWKNNGVFVAMPQQMLVTWGSSYNAPGSTSAQSFDQDPLLLRWSDISNYNIWDSSQGNRFAGQFRLPFGNRIVAGYQGSQQAFIWTEESLWSMQWLNDVNLVWGFNLLGKGCGLAGPRAFCEFNGVLFWVGRTNIYTYSSQGVNVLPCTVWDNLFQPAQTNPAILENICVGINSSFNEVYFFYNLENSETEFNNNRYIKYNILDNIWDIGVMGYDSWQDVGVFDYPVGAGWALDSDVSKITYNEYNYSFPDNADRAPLINSGFFAYSEGDPETIVDLIFPDFKYGRIDSDGTDYPSLEIVIRSKQNPQSLTYDQSHTFSDITSTIEYINGRCRGRLLSFEIRRKTSGNQGFWRMGNVRYRVAQGGRR